MRFVAILCVLAAAAPATAAGQATAGMAAAGPALVVTVKRAAKPAAGDAGKGHGPEGHGPKGHGPKLARRLAGEILRVVALDRDVPQKPIQNEVNLKAFPARRDAKSGRYVWDRLPPGTYDLYIETTAGKFEGADLRTETDSDKPLTDRDRKKIRTLFAAMKTWSNQKRVLALAGHGEEAVALVALLRTKKTSLRTREPFVVWRVELWRYRKLYGVWRRDADATVLRRFRASRKAFATWNWNFSPALGGIDVEAGGTRRIQRKLPAAFSVRLGRAGQPIDGA